MYTYLIWHFKLLVTPTGQVKVNRRLDYENLTFKLIKFRVRAFSRDGLRSVDANITIQVQDINDNVPQFSQSVSWV